MRAGACWRLGQAIATGFFLDETYVLNTATI